jgi:hypothetical protein
MNLIIKKEPGYDSPPKDTIHGVPQPDYVSHQGDPQYAESAASSHQPTPLRSQTLQPLPQIHQSPGKDQVSVQQLGEIIECVLEVW